LKQRQYQKYRDSNSLRRPGRPRIDEKTKLRNHVLFSDNFRDWLDKQMNPHETYETTLIRLLGESGKKLEALHDENERLRLQYSNLRASINNHEELNELLQVKSP
jgi:hypothetical protein